VKDSGISNLMLESENVVVAETQLPAETQSMSWSSVGVNAASAATATPTELSGQCTESVVT